MEFKFSLGDEVRDRITKYEGVIIGRTQWLTNCNTYLVKSRSLRDGKPMDSVSFDEPSIDLIAKEVLPEVKQKTGGPVESVAHSMV